MKNEEILERAIRKAIDGGWNPPEWVLWAVIGGEGIEPYAFKIGDEGYSDGWHDYDEFVSLKDIIFNRDFAKALWGEREATAKQTGQTIRLGYTQGWQHHLQQMVIAEDPIQYLADNMPSQ